MPVRILLPLDGSELSEQVLPTVKSFATAVGECSIDVLYVLDPTGVTDMGPGGGVLATYLDQTQEWAEGYVGDIAKDLRNVATTTSGAVRVGPPARMILDALEQGKYDYVFMATHGRSGLQRAMLGSVTDRVIRGAQVPVVAIHPKLPAAKQDVWPGDDAPADELIALFPREDVLSVRAVDALVSRGPAAVPALMAAIRAPKAETRLHAAKALGMIRDERAIPELVAHLHDHAWEVRWEAGESLIRFGEAGTKAVLEDAIHAPADASHNLAIAHVLGGAPLHSIHAVQPVLRALRSHEHAITVPIAASKALTEINGSVATAAGRRG